MKNKLVYKYIGKVLIAFAALMILPMIVCIINKENVIPFFIPSLISLSLGFIFNSFKIKNKILYAKDGFIIVALSWIIISLIGALPLFINKDASFIDSLFEAVSGLTTTGATIFKDVECLGKGILFWRAFMHFIGGMGVLAFVMAVIPLANNDKSMHVLKAEMPGPSVSKLVPGIKKTLFYLYGIYIALTVVECILLMIGGLPFFDSLLTAFSTAGTGGFATLNSSAATYYLFNKYVVALFMFLSGVNFNIYFLILMKDIKAALKSEELKVYLLLFVVSVLFIFVNTLSMFNNIGQAFNESFFHVSSIMTSTGFAVGDINFYPTTSRILILVLMLISACAGSTCGGFKISRLLILLKTIKRELLKAIHPNSVRTITFEGKKVDEDTVRSTCLYLLLYAIFIVAIMFIVSFDKVNFSQAVNATFTTFANVGLCFDISNFADFSILSKLVLSIGMLLGRLEILPMMVLFSDLKK